MGSNDRSWMSGSKRLATVVAVLLIASAASAQGRYKSLYQFGVNGDYSDGTYPITGVILDKAGNLYGITSGGGNDECSGGCGVVFELTRNARGRWTEKVLYGFCSLENCDDGYWPWGLIFDSAGNLYGSAWGGGASGAGVVFELSPNSDGTWTENVLYGFQSEPDGGGPVGSLVFDQAGNLYGMTRYGGNPCNCGTVFELAPNGNGTWSESVLYGFCSQEDCRDGDAPAYGLTIDQEGKLYGTTLAGGVGNNGVVFKLAPNRDQAWTETVLHRFTGGADGAVPAGTPILDAAGNLYGTTVVGGNTADCVVDGQSGCGVVYKLTPRQDAKWTETILHRFTGDDGSYPWGPVSLDQNGDLYGTVSRGGDVLCGGVGCGLVFKLTLNSNGRWYRTVVHRFFDKPGAFPFLGGLTFDGAGTIYGTTEGNWYGPPYTLGSVFEITP